MNSPDFEMSVGVANKELSTLYRKINTGDKFYTVLIDRENPYVYEIDFKFLAEVDIDRFKYEYTYVDDELKLWRKKS